MNLFSSIVVIFGTLVIFVIGLMSVLQDLLEMASHEAPVISERPQIGTRAAEQRWSRRENTQA